MKRDLRFEIFIAVLALLLLAIIAFGRDARPVVAQSGGGYDLTWSTIDGGGATFSTGGAYSLGGTIGQPDAGTLSGGGYTLGGGFWGGDNINGNTNLYLPLITR